MSTLQSASPSGSIQPAESGGAKLFPTPAQFFIVLLCYFSAHLVARTLISEVAGIDEGDQLVAGQKWSWGYGPQPPFYTWLLMLFTKIFGPSIFSLTLLRELMLFGIYSLTYFNARALTRSHSCGLAAAVALQFYPSIVWESQRELTHSILASLMILATLFAFLNLRPKGWAAYLAFGICGGLSVLSKYNAALFYVGILVAGLSLPGLRARILDRRMAVALGLSLLLILPNVSWVWFHRDLAFASLYKFGVHEETPWAVAVRMGLLDWVRSASAHIAPVLLIFAVLFWRPFATERGGESMASNPTSGRQLGDGLHIPLSSPKGGARPAGSTCVVPFEGRGEEVDDYQSRIPSPQPSDGTTEVLPAKRAPRSGGGRESATMTGRPSVRFHSEEERALWRTLLFMCAVAVLSVLCVKVTSFKDRWLQPVFVSLPILLVALWRDSLDRTRLLAMLWLGGLIGVGVLALAPGRMLLTERLNKREILNAPFRKLAPELAPLVERADFVVSSDRWLAGNLHLWFPDKLVTSPDLMAFYDPPGRRCLIVWEVNPRAAAGPPRALLEFARAFSGEDVQGEPVYLEEVWKYHRSRQIRLGALMTVMEPATPHREQGKPQ